MVWPMIMGLLGKVGMGAGTAAATGAGTAAGAGAGAGSAASVVPGVAGAMGNGLGGGAVVGPMSAPGMSTTASSVAPAAKAGLGSGAAQGAAPMGLLGKLGINSDSLKAMAGSPGQKQKPSGLLASGLAASKPQDLGYLHKLSKQPEKPQLQRRLPRNSYLSGLLGR